MKKQCDFRVRRVLQVAVVVIMFAYAGAAGAVVTVEQHLFRGGNEEDRAEYFAQDIGFWGSGRYPEESEFKSRLYKLRTGSTYYALWCLGKVDKDSGDWKTSVGMPKPGRANWHTNGFYSVIINGEAAQDYKAAVEDVSGGEKGMVKISWDHPDAVVRAEFTLLDGDDKLIITTNVEPKRRIPGYEVRLLAYPSSLAGGYDRGLAVRDREGLTAKRVLEREEREDNTGLINTDLEKDEPWVLFYDNHFDVAQTRGEGPCAALFSPEEVTAARVSVHTYHCRLMLNYPAADSPVSSHIAVWDFHGMTNHEAKEYMKNISID